MSFEQIKSLLEEHKGVVASLKAADVERSEEIQRLGSATQDTEQKMREIHAKLDCVEEQVDSLETALQRKNRILTQQDGRKTYTTPVMAHQEAFNQFLSTGSSEPQKRTGAVGARNAKGLSADWLWDSGLVYGMGLSEIMVIRYFFFCSNNTRSSGFAGIVSSEISLSINSLRGGTPNTAKDSDTGMYPNDSRYLKSRS